MFIICYHFIRKSTRSCYSDLWCGIILDGDISCITVASHICIASVSGPAAPTLLSFRRSSTTKGRQRPGLSGLGLGSAWARPGQIGQARATDSWTSTKLGEARWRDSGGVLGAYRWCQSVGLVVYVVLLLHFHHDDPHWLSFFSWVVPTNQVEVKNHKDNALHRLPLLIISADFNIQWFRPSRILDASGWRL